MSAVGTVGKYTARTQPTVRVLLPQPDREGLRGQTSWW